ncbi:flavodoxin [Anaerocolumna cellulosilytica]|uniref:Flavodoxin n=1 Tax=Anaerocolumna cellulosilytica TaxID=433286 RepID=A0A6S6R6S9_9FIRM|nr:flavodoxin domain-containing protein [Anaerocolumna cellulosilytica]MBB5194065.1 menaquinone-dependent protoporphyrinogen oxidase [Anaerocolumna cellulosilytica]BCJ94721.1 flavodoxin [Anaerocolumna cellulosilytica]
MKSIIIYTTRYGCTAEVARRIQKELGDECTIIDIKKESVPLLDTFDTVILGGSIYIGKVQKEMTLFCTTNLEQLLTKKIGLYISAGAQTQEECYKELLGAFPSELHAHATTKNVLGYAFSFDKMRFFDKLIMKKIKGNAVNTATYFEERIAQFAKGITAGTTYNETSQAF